MSKFEARPGSGVLFHQSDKKNERGPDYKGNIVLDADYKRGETIKVAGWRKSTPKGHLISLMVEAPYKNASEYPKPVHDDDIPF